MFLNDFKNLPKEFVKNVKYRITNEDTDSYLVNGILFKKPLDNIEVGEIFCYE